MYRNSKAWWYLFHAPDRMFCSRLSEPAIIHITHTQCPRSKCQEHNIYLYSYFYFRYFRCVIFDFRSLLHTEVTSPPRQLHRRLFHAYHSLHTAAKASCLKRTSSCNTATNTILHDSTRSIFILSSLCFPYRALEWAWFWDIKTFWFHCVSVTYKCGRYGSLYRYIIFMCFRYHFY